MMDIKTTMRRAICVLCLALVAGLMFALPAYAMKADSNYTYTVRVYPGNIGECSAGECLSNDGIAAGTVESFSIDSKGTTLTYNGGTIKVPSDSKYYIKGVRKSGQDDGIMANTVNEDLDFVVDYGVKGEMVSYTISFIDYNTKRALTADNGQSSVTYYGKVGDKPVVPYEHITGYRPRYLNITGTLGPEGTNKWTLEYISTTTGGTTTGGGTAAGGGAAAGGAAAGGAAAGGAAAGGAAAGGAAAGGAAAGGAAAGAEGGAAAGGAAAGGAAAATPPATEEIGDVDNPLASGNEGEAKTPTTPEPEKVEDNENATSGGGVPVGLIYGGAAVIVAAVAAAAIILRRRNS